VPRPATSSSRRFARIEWYLREAVPLFVLGTAILFTADRLHLLGGIERAARPIVTRVLGLPSETAPAFVIGFLRRDFGAPASSTWRATAASTRFSRSSRWW
jgi:ferrous iron transport protein B